LAENWYVLGLCYDKTGDGMRAEAAFRKCVAIKPSYARAWNDLGVMAARKGHDKEGAHDAFCKSRGRRSVPARRVSTTSAGSWCSARSISTAVFA
jgi:Tfp pilus assembly protein PilF